MASSSVRWLSGRWRGLGLITAAVAVGMLGYLLAAVRRHGLGFPLDDAWIHQTYARNLVQRGEWAFVRGVPSAGSTSPLWSLLQSGGHALGLQPVLWSALLGAALLVGLGVLAGRWWRTRSGAPAALIALVGLVIVSEWHLLWAALSGMEILALALVALAALSALERPVVRWGRLGALIGLGLWLRPDALSLLLPAGWVLLFQERSWRARARSGFTLAAGLGAFILPYLLFNQALSGTLWPTTFYAKQTEYQILTDAPLLARLGAQFLQPFVGVGAALGPGILISLAQRLRFRQWSKLAPLIWVGGFLTAYALRLPVTYQHGRYAMPVIPVLLVLGLEGLYRAAKPLADEFWPRTLSRAWVLVVGVSALAFAGLGARAYSTDVAIIETEMVRSAHWVNSHTEPEALIAAHDIGALGYYGERRILDLAGLVSPEVIGFMRDEAALAVHLDRRGADYLMTFPGWYPRLVEQAELVFASDAIHSPLAGGENMAIYRWRR